MENSRILLLTLNGKVLLHCENVAGKSTESFQNLQVQNQPAAHHEHPSKQGKEHSVYLNGSEVSAQHTDAEIQRRESWIQRKEPPHRDKRKNEKLDQAEEANQADQTDQADQEDHKDQTDQADQADQTDQTDQADQADHQAEACEYLIRTSLALLALKKNQKSDEAMEWVLMNLDHGYRVQIFNKGNLVLLIWSGRLDPQVTTEEVKIVGIQILETFYSVYEGKINQFYEEYDLVLKEQESNFTVHSLDDHKRIEFSTLECFLEFEMFIARPSIQIRNLATDWFGNFLMEDLVLSCVLLTSEDHVLLRTTNQKYKSLQTHLSKCQPSSKFWNDISTCCKIVNSQTLDKLFIVEAVAFSTCKVRIYLDQHIETSFILFYHPDLVLRMLPELELDEVNHFPMNTAIYYLQNDGIKAHFNAFQQKICDISKHVFLSKCRKHQQAKKTENSKTPLKHKSKPSTQKKPESKKETFKKPPSKPKSAPGSRRIKRTVDPNPQILLPPRNPIEITPRKQMISLPNVSKPPTKPPSKRRENFRKYRRPKTSNAEHGIHARKELHRPTEPKNSPKPPKPSDNPPINPRKPIKDLSLDPISKV